MNIRSNDKHTGVAERLRQQILCGDLPLGSRLPARRELERTFNASRVTIQRASDRLKREGFIVARGAVGTFVADRPPHLTNYALAFYDNPNGGEYERFSRFFQALNSAANGYTDDAGRKVTPFYNCNGLIESPDYCKLTSDVSSRRLSGVIFAFPPSRNRLPENSSLLTGSNLPRVTIASGNNFGIPCICPDRDGFLRQAVAHLKSHGRTRIATINHERSLTYNRVLFEAMKAQGLPIVPYWHQHQDHLHPEPAFNCAHLLFNPQQKERPDALIVTDDNLAEAAVAGVAAAGVRVPDEVEIVVHCNWPLPPKTVLPVTRIGFDANELVNTCIRILDAQRAGQTPPQMTILPAVMKPGTGYWDGGSER